MREPRIQKMSVQAIRRHLDDGVFAVPKLQREFVWDGRRAAKLLDSIYQNMPIGSLVVWETEKKNFYLLRQDLHILPPFNQRSHRGWFLIDGQQRLSVLHQAFKGEQKTNSMGKVIDFGRLCFVPRPADGESHFVHRRPVDRQYIPIGDILRGGKRFMRRFPKWLRGRLTDCRERVTRYRVPTVVVQSADLDEVRETFVRINSQGMKIGAADRAFARAAKVDLRSHAHALRAGLSTDFHHLDYNAILQGFAFLTHERELDVGGRALQATVDWWERQILRGRAGQSQFTKRWRKYRTAFSKSLDYLRNNFSVLDPSFLPYPNMLATLSVFFFHHPAAPGSSQRRELRRWFWATGVCQRYSGRGFRNNLIADVRFFRRLAGSNGRFKLGDRAFRHDVLRTSYTQRSALASAFFCLLAKRKPVYVANGEPIPLKDFSARANRDDRHHIFPKALLAPRGFSAREYNSLCNICFVVAEENQQFGAKRPDRYLGPFMKKRHFGRAMRSHLIPTGPNSGLTLRNARKAFRKFRTARLELVCAEFNREAELRGLGLFRRE